MVRIRLNKKHRLLTFNPLCLSKQGRTAIEKYGLPQFIDASCRREPDLQSSYPSISALCRGGSVAPKLEENDMVAYMTKQSRYKPYRFVHWRLVAILRVMRRFESHEEAAAWYNSNDLPLPGNCMVAGNNHLPFDMTGGFPSKLAKVTNIDAGMKVWDAEYRRRAEKWGRLLVCEADYLELYNPPVISRETMLHIFGRTFNITPPPISAEQFEALRLLAVAAC